MEMIPRPNLPNALVNTLVQLAAQQADPLAAGIARAGQGIAGGIDKSQENKEKYALRELEVKKLDRQAAMELIKHLGARLDKGVHGLGAGRTIEKNGAEKEDAMAGLAERAGLPAGTKLTTGAADKNHIEINDDMLSAYPQLKKMGWSSGDTVPAAVFNAHTKSDELTEQERVMMSRMVKDSKPEDFIGVRPEMARAMFPQTYFDPANPGQVVTVPKNAKPLPRDPNDKRPASSEFKARGFADRAQAADDKLSDLMATGYDPTRILSSRGELVPNAVKDKNDQVAEQIMEDFVRAVLRPESGAAIPDNEMATEIRRYFPMRGDKPEVLASKAESRKAVIAALEGEASRVPSKYKRPESSGQAAMQLRAEYKEKSSKLDPNSAEAKKLKDEYAAKIAEAGEKK